MPPIQGSMPGEAQALRWCGALALTLTSVALSARVPSQSANELSDAARSVFLAFPQATSFRAIVRDVDLQARIAVEKGLPFKVHFNELGAHSLYVPFRKLEPVGLLYVRTEDGGWGFTEVSWSLSLDLRVLGFRFLRCRSPHRAALQRSPFARSLIGRGFEQLGELLGRDGRLCCRRGDIPAGSEELARALVRSAMKTILVTRTVWRRELRKLRDLALGLQAFPAAQRVLPMALGAMHRDSHLRAVHAVTVFGTADARLGVAVASELHAATTTELRWTLTKDLRVIRVTVVGARCPAALRVACSELAGRRLDDPGRGALSAAARDLDQALREALRVDSRAARPPAVPAPSGRSPR